MTHASGCRHQESRRTANLARTAPVRLADADSKIRMPGPGGWAVFTVFRAALAFRGHSIEHAEHRRDIPPAHLDLCLFGKAIEELPSIAGATLTEHRKELVVERLVFCGRPARRIAHKPVRQCRAGDKDHPPARVDGRVSDG